jgi:LuxR family transcriptional regulator, maltose regulon positive regulatory protein
MALAGAEGIKGGEQTIPPLPVQREPLLRTKLYVPPLRPNRVARPRLMERINRGQDKALILVSAPAGYGKTTLASSWLRETELAAAWFSMDEGDNDPIRFLQNLIASLQNVIPAIQPEMLSMLQGSKPASYESLLSILINELTEREDSFALILDDFHLIHAQSVFDMLAFLLEHVPPQMHLVILSRTDPPLPLFKLRARDQLLEIRAEQLRFNNEEVATFLNEVMGLRLNAGDISAMEARTEGWIAGLQLAALSLQGCHDPHSFVSAFTGSHHYIMDYLTEEALKLQPEGVRSFLLKTSILSSMCGPLCDAILGDRGYGIGDRESGTAPLSSIPYSPSQSILDYLEKSNLFVVPMDDRRQWYRYHHLFAEMLMLRLAHTYPEELPELHRRASRWYEINDMFPEAIRHAMEAGDRAHAAHLVEQHGCSLLMRGESFTLLSWVEAVESFTHSHPWLAILKAWAYALTRQLDQVEPALQTATGLFSAREETVEVKIMLGSMAAVRAHVANLKGDWRRAVDFAQRALKNLPDSNDFSCSMRSVATSILGDASWMSGNLEEARRAYLEAVRISQEAGNLYMNIISSANLAEVLTERGELHLANRILVETLEKASRPDGQKLPLADRIFYSLGRISYEWDELEEADQYIRQGIELCQQWGNNNLLASSNVRLARLEQARGNPEKARQALQAAEGLARAGCLSLRQSTSVKTALARWWITRGNPERAGSLMLEMGIKVDSLPREVEIPHLQEPEYLLLMRLWLAQGKHEAARALSDRLLQKAEGSGKIGQVIEILVLQALAWQGKKDLAQALAVLERALSLARPQGYARVFLDEGEPMTKLLHQARRHLAGGGYEDELLGKLGRRPVTGEAHARPPVESLTLREVEVLKLIEAGYSNQEIAAALFISIPTVKRHISNIYTKIGAKNRTQAVSLGKKLRLFE